MRRPSLSTKLLAAAVPLLIAIGALLFVTVRNDLEMVNDAERSAQLGAVWSPMVDALSAVDAERDLATAETTAADETIATARKATDDAIAAVRTSIEALGENPAAVAHITSARSSLSAARRNLDMAAANMTVTTQPLPAYGVASSELVSVARLLPPAAGSPALGRQLLAVQKIAESNLAAGQVIAGVNQFTADPTSPNPLISARNSLDQLESTLNEFGVIAPEEWASQFRRSGMTIGFASFRIDVDRALRASDATDIEPIDVDAFSTLITNGNEFQRQISSSIVDQAEADAAETRRATLIRIGIIAGAVALAMLVTWFLTRSIAKRVRAVAKAANQVATRQLPALVHAMRDPKGRALPTIEAVNAKGSDELAELAESFNTMQRTLVSVAEEQVAVLRKGVSDIFITMARRNRSLVDRQLAMLDGFEAQVDDPDVLSNYYQLDHLATRMRRNAESLLVLANEEPRRRRVGPTDVDNVVRASIGEIEDYRRIEVEHLDSMKVRGNVVADIAHLFAELLDNAAQFSPPDSTVRVGGRRTPDGYTVRINDAGMGINADRLEELNELLKNPPIVGLSVEPTLGMSVVSLLAAKHGIKVTLSAGAPGLTVDVELPSVLSADAPEPVATVGGAPADQVAIIPVTVPASVPAPAPASNSLRIDEAVAAQFAAGQGPQLTSASVNNLDVAAEPMRAGINGFGSHDHGTHHGDPVDPDAVDADSIVAQTIAPAGDDTSFVIPDSFGSDDSSYGNSEIAGLGSGSGMTAVSSGTGAGAADVDSTFAMPDTPRTNTPLTVDQFAQPTMPGASGGDGNIFAMPNVAGFETALATGGAGDGSTFAMPAVAGTELSLATDYAEPTMLASEAGQADTFALPGVAGTEHRIGGDFAGPTAPTAAAGAAGNAITFPMPDVPSSDTVGSHLAAPPSHLAGGSTDERSDLPMPDVELPEARPIYTRIDPYRTETAADAAERDDNAFVMDESAFTLPSVFGADMHLPVADAERAAPTPMFRPAVLDFGGAGEPEPAPVADDLDHPAQLDRPNITARLTNAFQRSHLTHTPPAAAPPRASSPPPEVPTAQLTPSGAAGIAAPTVQPAQRPTGEFSRPLSPPVSAAGPTSQPVTPADAHPAPPIVTRAPLSSPLPTRRASEVDGGHDRMADLPSSVSVNRKSIDEEAEALAAALAAFDRRLDNHHAANANATANANANGNGNGNGNGLGNGAAPPSRRLNDSPSLPTRSPAAVTTPMSNYNDQPESTTTSRLDPEQLRERLRSFHTGVRGAVATDDAPTPASDSEYGENRP